MSKRFRWILVGLVVGLAVGGVAYAVVVTPPAPSDRYYACVSTLGVVRSGTIRLNAAPTTCPKSTDTVRSWSAQGPTGPTGVTGPGGSSRSITWPTGINGPTGADPVEYIGTYALTVTTDGCDIVNPNLSYTFDDIRVRLVRLDGADLGVVQGACGYSNPGSGLNLSNGQVRQGLRSALTSAFPGGGFRFESFGGAVDTYFSDDPTVAPNNDPATWGGGWIRCAVETEQSMECSVLDELTVNALNQEFPATMSAPFAIRRVPVRIPIPTTTTTSMP